MMIQYHKKECSNHSFKLGSSIFCNCGIPFATAYRNMPCFHVFCQTCINKEDSQNKCLSCESVVERVHEIHPNEELFVCTILNCKQAFLNFVSLKVHALLSHSVNVNTPEEFYEKFGDLELQIPQNEVIRIEKDHFKKVSDKIPKGKSSSPQPMTPDSTESKSPKSNIKRPSSDYKEDELEKLM